MGGQPRRSRDEPTAVAARDVVARPPSRVIIEDVTPQVDGGRFAAKRAVGEAVDVGATIFAEGHDLLSARDPLAPRRGARLARRADGRPRQRRVDGSLRRRDARPIRVHGRGLDRSLRQLAARVRAQGRGGSGRRERAARRSGPGARRGHTSGRHGRRMARRACRRARRNRRTADPRATRRSRRSCTRRWRVIRIATGRPSSPSRSPSRSRCERAAFGAWYECFRAPCRPIRRGPARCATSRTASPTSPGWASTSSTCRRSIPIGDVVPQGPQQHARSPEPGDPGSPWAIGAARRRPHRRASRARHARRLRRAWSRARASTASRSRSTSPSSARPIIRRSASTPSGSGTGPTARSSTPRTRPKKYQDIYPFDFETAALARAVGRAARRRALLGRRTA